MKRWSVLLLVLLCAACDADGVLELSLAEASFDLERALVDRYRVELLDETLSVVDVYEISDGASRADVATLAPGSTRRLRVEGSLGTSTIAAATGLSKPLTLRDGLTERVVIPFSSREVLVALPKLHAAAGGFVVSGVLDDWVASPSRVLDQSWLMAGPGGTDDDFWAVLYLAWDQQRLYLALEVHDDCPALEIGELAGNCDVASAIDTLLFGINGDGQGQGGFGAGDFWVELVKEGAVVREGTVTPDDVHLAKGLLPGGRGWLFEASVRWSAIGRSAAPGPSDRIGIGLLVIDADPGETMASTYGLSKVQLGANSESVAPVNMLSIGFPSLD